LAELLLPESGRLNLTEVLANVDTFIAAFNNVTLPGVDRLLRGMAMLDANGNWPLAFTDQDFPTVPMVPDLLAARHRVVERDLGPLPAGGGLASGGHPFPTVAVNFDQQAAFQLGSAVGTAISAGQSRTQTPPADLASKMEASALSTVLKYAHQPDAASLIAVAPVWQRWAECKAKDRADALEAAMIQAQATHYHNFPRCTAVIQPSLAKDIWEGRLSSDDLDITAGLSAFRFGYSGAIHNKEARKRKGASLIVLNGATVSLSDMVSLDQLEASNLAAPTNYVELKVSDALHLYACCALWGPDHPSTVAWKSCVEDLISYESFYSEQFQFHTEQPIQLLVHQAQREINYVDAHVHTSDWRDIPAPKLLAIQSKIRARGFVPPTMPEGFRTDNGTVVTDSLTPDSMSLGDMSSLTSASSQQRQTIVNVHIDGQALRRQLQGGGSGGGGGGGGGGGDDGRSTGRIVIRQNENNEPTGPDESLRADLKGKALAGQHLKHKDEWPKVEGTLVCFPYIVGGRCFSNCSRKHLDKGQTTAAVYADVKKVCQLIGSSN
jgi:hypothetical protein